MKFVITHQNYSKSYNKYRVKQNNTVHEHTSIFCFCLTALSWLSLFCGHERGQAFVQPAASDIYGFFVFVSMEESGRRRFLPRIGFIFSLKFFGFHTMFTQLKNRLFQETWKKENHKKETELYYSMPLCPL